MVESNNGSSSSSIDESGSNNNISNNEGDLKGGKDKNFFNNGDSDNNSDTVTSSSNTTTTTTTTSAGRIKEPREGHSRSQQRKLANYRKDMVFSLSSQGYNQTQISSILHVTQSTISLTLQELRRDAAASMRDFLSHKLPLI